MPDNREGLQEGEVPLRDEYRGAMDDLEGVAQAREEEGQQASPASQADAVNRFED